MKLDLSYEGLRELPSDFFQQHKDLEELNLEKNNLVTLPPEIGQLYRLQKLDLENNQLIELPPEIEPLQNLEIIRTYACISPNYSSEINSARNRAKFL